MAGYSGTSLSKKLGIKEGCRVALVAAPAGYPRALGALPPGAIVKRQARAPLDVLLWFVTRRADLERRFVSMADRLEPDGGLWVSWPKRAAGVETDVTENVVREIGLDAGLVDNKVCAVDDIWSGLQFVRRLADRSR